MYFIYTYEKSISISIPYLELFHLTLWLSQRNIDHTTSVISGNVDHNNYNVLVCIPSPPENLRSDIFKHFDFIKQRYLNGSRR